MAELEGRKLDRYELRRLVGKGGMANVYEAHDPNFHREVAIKVFKREDEEMLRRFVREARLMASLRHPHLVEVYDTGECVIDGVTRYYIVMPLLTGGTLRMRIRRSPLGLAEVCQCLRDIASALDYIHAQGIVHRDIKGSNVLLNSEGRCYLTDFGIARITSDATQLTSTGNVLGTVDYVAPELFEVGRKADARTDLYSLGVLLYEMVTGRLPFSADNQLALISMHVSKQPPSPRQFVPQLSGEIERVILKTLSKKPEARYASAGELATAFCKAVQRSGVSVPGFSKSGVDLEKNAPAELAQAAIGSEPRPGSPKATGIRPSPLANATEGLVLEPAGPQGRVVLPGPQETTPTIYPNRKPPRSRQRMLAIIGAIVLVLLAAPLIYVTLSQRNTSKPPAAQGTATVGGQNPSPIQGSPTPNPTQTAQAVSTASAQATATAVVAPTATAQAQATATVGPLATATAGQLDYQDALDNAANPATRDSQWDQSSQCLFNADGYHVKQPASPTYFKGCREQSRNYGNLALTVNISMLSGHSGGVYFHLQTNLIGNYDAYLFEIDSHGSYRISRQQGISFTPLHDWSTSPALHTGYGVKNLLQFVVRGDTYQFYANGQFLTQVQDSYYATQVGGIAFLASADSGGDDADVVYSDLKVYQL
ncbi:MAG TPA: protein kinase [Ktedonobacteraceae bacterium]|nr:protein kinase [Ktedonobacteraceae bacterium]